MTTGDEQAPPKGRILSYSQGSTLSMCPKQYQLSKVIKVPRNPGWYLVGGTAIHATIERFLRQKTESA